MATFENQPHFIQMNSVQTVSGDDVAADVLSLLHTRNLGAFLVMQGTQLTVVNSEALADEVFDQARRSGWGSLSGARIGTFIPNLAMRSTRSGVPGALILEPPVSAGAIADPVLNDPAFRAMMVREQGREIGLFVNHENFAATIFTAPPIFYCEIGHPNSTFDSGYCGSCPAKIRV